MQAPPLKKLDLEMERIRCKCGSENFVFAPCPWYEGQGLFAIEPGCKGCGASLLPLTVPNGCRWEHYLLDGIPVEIAREIGAELEDEIERTVATPAAPMGADRWSEPHEASSAYEAWLQSRAAPPPEDRTRFVQNAVCTGLLALFILLCVVL